MAKLTYKDKIDLYNDYKNGLSISTISKKYNKRTSGITYLVRLIDKHGFDILKTVKNKKYNYFLKQDAIERVLINHEPIWTVAIDIGLPSDGLLHSWISKYKEDGYNIVERKRGRPTMKKDIKHEKKETIEEKVKRLEKENEYLKAEIEYSKKLRAVVQARKNQQQKKK